MAIKKDVPTEVYTACYSGCRSRYENICLRLPIVTMLTNTIYQLSDSKDPDSGVYIERNGHPLVSNSSVTPSLPKYCPFAQPTSKSKRKRSSSSLDSEESLL